VASSLRNNLIYQTARRLSPAWVKRQFQWVVLQFDRVQIMGRGLQNRRRNTADVFAAIYRSGKWSRGGREYNSGPGTEDKQVAGLYLSVVQNEIGHLEMSGKRFVDLGCGDFRIASRLACLAGSYVGVDIVPALVDSLNTRYGNEQVAFLCANIIDDPLPEGDICFVRQVFQHLSNSQILRVLPKLRAYKHVLITEHVPNRATPYTANLDLAHGPDIRLFWNSGIFLDQYPFSLPTSDLREILSVPGTQTSARDNGEIVTWIYTPGAR
jgi:SAM-dependent methyltransferase